MQLRNPWGKFEWSGNWGDNSDCWTSDLKKTVSGPEGWVEVDDGSFWMDFEDLKKNFSEVSINKYVLENEFSSLKISHSEVEGKYTVFKVKIAKEGDYTFSVSQMGEKAARISKK